MDEHTLRERLRALPSIDELLSRPSLQSLFSGHPRQRVVEALREAVDDVRSQILAGADRAFAEADVSAALARRARPRLRRVLNATGVVLHTNLGRAPLPAAALERIRDVAGYCNLEFDLDTGERGTRYAPLVGLLGQLTGAEDALVVNNCAAAVLLALTGLAQGKEVVVSRGELVEIGGGFRIPEVMRQSGALMVEVGTTNRTRLADYEQVLRPATGLLAKIHRSNFGLVGFTEEASVVDLALLAARHQLPLFADMGSGALSPTPEGGPAGLDTVASLIRAGADLVAFSGDKLLGGPQAGVLVGRRGLIAQLKKHPLNRALRIDKLTVAALEATLELYRDGVEDEAVPARALLKAPLEIVARRAATLSALLSSEGVAHDLVSSEGRVGGGSLPLAVLESRAVALESESASELARLLRNGSPPVVGRLLDGRVLLDVRCIADADCEALARGVVGAMRKLREGVKPP